MIVEIQMPELGAEVTQGTLLAWLVGVGDQIKSGDLIAELETDKSTVELESEHSGTVTELLIAEGSEGVKIGTVLAKIEASADSPPVAAPNPAPPAAQVSQPVAAPVIEEQAAVAPQAVSAVAEEVAASPLARRLATQVGVDLTGVAGSGAHGRIVRADVEAVAGGTTPVADRAKAAARAAKPTSPAVDTTGVELIRHSAMRRTIARRLSESKQTVPHFYLRVVCRVDELLRARKSVNAAADVKISVNDFVVRAAALSLREHPAVNVSWTDEAMLKHSSIDVSVAVATEGGLITPVVRAADRKGLAALSTEIRGLALRARDGKLQPAEYQGGSLTVSNLGMFGIESVYAIVNPPQSCILGVGEAAEQAVVIDGRLEVGSVMTCTLSADHRAVDGALGAQFLATFKKFIEDPVSMVL